MRPSETGDAARSRGNEAVPVRLGAAFLMVPKRKGADVAFLGPVSKLAEPRRCRRRAPGGAVDLVVVGSKPGTVTGRVTISAAAEYLIELSRCPVVVLPRGVAVRFGS
jgi:hypothetical protein